MFNKKGIYILAVVIILCTFSVSAISFSAEIDTVNNRITVSDAAEFQLTILNYEPKSQVFRIKTSDYPRWDIRTKPIKNPILVDVPPNSNSTITLYIDPNQNYIGQLGSHFVNVNVISESSGEAKTLQPRVAIVSPGEIEMGYVPTVIPKIDFPDKINPSEDINFSIILTNQNNLNISGAVLSLSSKFINEEIELDLSPKERKVVEIRKKIDPKTKPTEDDFIIKMVYKGKDVFSPHHTNYEIVPYVNIEDETTKKNFLLGNTETIVFTNEGNVRFKGDFTVPAKSFRRFFTSTKPDANIVREGGQLYYSWPVVLEPFETSSVKITENYLGIVLLLIVIIALCILFYLNRSPVHVRKTITETEMHEGGLSKLRVLINVRNRSLAKIKDISIVDKIPKLLQLEKHTSLGSLKPSKIQRNKRNETLMLWKIDELTSGEERVITYHLKSNLNILGGLSLQPAVAKFRDKDKEVRTRSNRAFVRG